MYLLGHKNSELTAMLPHRAVFILSVLQCYGTYRSEVLTFPQSTLPKTDDRQA